MNSTITVELPRIRFVQTASGFVAVKRLSRLDQIVARQQASQLISGLFAISMAASAILFALGIAG